MAAWRLAGSLLQLRSELNALWPKRDKTSDGSIGDQSHANRNSDHNPNRWGVVTAIDIDADITNDRALTFQIAEYFRLLGKSGFKPLSNGGYIIFFGKIASDMNGWVWKTYTGINAHKSHLHVSAGNAPAQFDSMDSWRLRELVHYHPPRPVPNPTPKPKDDRMYALIKGDKSDEIWLTDFITKRKMEFKEEWEFMAWNIRRAGGIVQTEGDYGPVVINQGIVDRIGRGDTANVVDDTFRWWAANPETSPFEEVINKILDERDAKAAETPTKAKAATKKSS